MAENTPRIIKTPFFSNKAKEVLDSVLGQLSDGIWENSGRMEKYWRFAEVKTAPDNRVYIEIENVSGKPTYDHRWTTNGFFRMSDDEVIQFFAGKVKYIMQQEYTATMNALNIQKEAALNEIEAKFVILRKEAHDKYNEQIKGIDAQI